MWIDQLYAPGLHLPCQEKVIESYPAFVDDGNPVIHTITHPMDKISAYWGKIRLSTLLILVLAGCDMEQPAGEATSSEPVSIHSDTYVDVSKEPLSKDLFGKVASLPETPHPHWVWIADFAASSMPDGRAYLYDGDTARLLGALNTGYSFNALNIPGHYREIYSAETYYARTTRGKRTDVVSIYDPFKLSFVAEIEIPAKRASTIPRLADSALTDDDRFMAVFNLTPAASLSIVDLEQRRFAGEIITPGCTMAYAAGERRFFALCSDGSLLLIDITDEGTQGSAQKSEPFFNALEDPILETGVRHGDTWYFMSVLGKVHPVDISAAGPVFADTWWYLDEEQREANWRIGGMQPVTLHNAGQRLYILLHQGDFFSYEAPGTEIWVYDLATHERTSRIKTNHPSSAIAVSQDDSPLLYTITEDLSSLDIYNATSGKYLRSANELGIVPSLIQPLPLP